MTRATNVPDLTTRARVREAVDHAPGCTASYWQTERTTSGLTVHRCLECGCVDLTGSTS